jgi:hypothetical protein
VKVPSPAICLAFVFMVVAIGIQSATIVNTRQSNRSISNSLAITNKNLDAIKAAREAREPEEIILPEPINEELPAPALPAPPRDPVLKLNGYRQSFTLYGKEHPYNEQLTFGERLGVGIAASPHLHSMGCFRCQRSSELCDHHATWWWSVTEAQKNFYREWVGDPFVDVVGGEGCSPLCEDCWRELSPDERLPYYKALYDLWESQRKFWPAPVTAPDGSKSFIDGDRYKPKGEREWQAIEAAVRAGQ